MVSAFSSNIQLEEPARGDQVGVWDTPVNSNMNVIDLISGGIATIALNNSPVVLASGQYQCREIIFSSTLTGSVSITFPTSFRKNYEIYNTCTGSSAFTITLQTTAAGGQVICAPPGEIVDIRNDGTSIRYKNLGRVGTLWEYGGSSVPAWVAGCTVAPYLNCDGTSFSSATFPFLTNILGGTTLPDSRGRVRATLNQATSRLLSSNGGVDGNTNLAAGGADSVTLGASQIPTIQSAGFMTTSSGYLVPISQTVNDGNFSGSGAGTHFPSTPGSWTSTSAFSVSVTSTNTGGALHINTQPTYVGGLTLIRTG